MQPGYTSHSFFIIQRTIVGVGGFEPPKPKHLIYSQDLITILGTLPSFKELFLRRRKDSNFHGLIHGQFITPDRSTLLCLPLHHILHISEHMVGFEPTMPFRIGFCRPMPSTTRPHVHFCSFGLVSNQCFLASRL